MALHNEPRKTCLIYSAGGHYAELVKALEGINFDKVYHVTFYSPRFKEEMNIRRIYITHPRKRILRTLGNMIQALWVLLNERPKLIISTGADVAVPTIILGKLLFRCTVIFIESGGDISPTLSGRMVYRFSDLFIIQWENQLKYYPNATVSKGLLL